MSKLKKVRNWSFVLLSLLIITVLVLFIPSGKKGITVGSKNFTEQVILGEMVSTLIEENSDIKVNRKLNLGGTLVCFTALKEGGLDLYVDYIGTGLTVILKKEVIPDWRKVYKIVKDEFQKKFDLIWLEPLGFNNTYTLTMRRKEAEELKIEKISDLRKYTDLLLPGFDHEFMERPDGYPGLIKHYGFKFKKEPREMDSGLMYKAIDEKEVDIIDAFATDGRIPAFDLLILKDDKNFFPPYHAAPLIRKDTLKKYPQIKEILNRLAFKIDDRTMQQLNSQVDEEGKRVKDVARDFLEKNGLI